MILYTQKQIEEAIKKFADKTLKPILKKQSNINFVSVLSGSIFFTTELLKHLQDFDIKLLFIKAKSYHNNEQSNSIIITKIDDISTKKLKDSNVYIIDDIYDTGNTIHKLKEYLSTKEPKSITSITLLRKKDVTDTYPDYWLLECEKDQFVYGYGLDNNGKQRHIQEIRIVTKE